MAQLIKLQDYISRYEQNLTRYCNQFVRLKQQRWQDKKEEAGITENSNATKVQSVKKQFLTDMFDNQLRWASSTAFEKSLLDPQYETDQWLKKLLSELPDTYLLMYEPVFQIAQAPVELEAILIAPLEVYCLAFLKGEKDEIYQASSERFWTVWRDDKQEKVINPLISLRRSNAVLSRLIKKELPMKQLLIATDGYVDHFYDWHIECIDKRNLQQWIREHATNPTPMKSLQIKVARELLNQTRTEYYERIDDSTISWEIEQNH